MKAERENILFDELTYCVSSFLFEFKISNNSLSEKLSNSLLQVSRRISVSFDLNNKVIIAICSFCSGVSSDPKLTFDTIDTVHFIPFWSIIFLMIKSLHFS